jgi:hypothetical protein
MCIYKYSLLPSLIQVNGAVSVNILNEEQTLYSQFNTRVTTPVLVYTFIPSSFRLQPTLLVYQ